tara:strand:+ start:2400 stop:2762 length:363 start_codon:yes stop_codon:yes gene_type:complete
MRLLICGDRRWNDRQLVRETLKKHLKEHEVKAIIHGDARGADSIGWQEAHKLWPTAIEIKHPANWVFYGKGAGLVRNREMLTIGKPNLIIAFSPNIIESVGTTNMLTLAEDNNIDYALVP